MANSDQNHKIGFFTLEIFLLVDTSINYIEIQFIRKYKNVTNRNIVIMTCLVYIVTGIQVDKHD